MTTAAPGWDVFISYASTDFAWVNEELYGRLRSRQRTDGRGVSVFIDREIPPAVPWVTYLSDAIRMSTYFVAVYSCAYFQQPWCQAELRAALRLHIGSERIIPILYEPQARERVPFILGDAQWLDVRGRDWFDRLCDLMGFTSSRLRLRVAGSLTDVVFKHTLPALEVRVVDDAGAPIAGHDAITVTAEPGTVALEGTLTRAASGEAAVFSDLLVAAPAAEVRLKVEAAGCQPVFTDTFSVAEPPSRVLPQSAPAAPLPPGTPIFLPDDRSLAVLAEGAVVLGGLDGTEVGRRGLPGPMRLAERTPGWLALADWEGNVLLASALGETRTFDLSQGGSPTVPGCLCSDDGRIYVGMWEGSVWSLGGDDAGPEPLFRHPGGVQGLARVGDQWLVAGMDGELVRYPDPKGEQEPRVEADAATFEPCILGMATFTDCVVAVGRRWLYRWTSATGRVIRLRSPLPEHVAAAVDNGVLILLGVDGSGVRLDSQLKPLSGFHTSKGARPCSVGAAGRVIALDCPDGSHVLVVQDRLVFVHPDGPVAVSGDGSRVALSDGTGTRVEALEDLLASGGTP